MSDDSGLDQVPRRRFLEISLGILGLGLSGAVSGLAGATTGVIRERRAGKGRRSAHPDPRPDVDGSLVLNGEAVLPHVAELFDGIRGIPHIADGIGCHCGCGAMPEMRSLLSCYEGIGMAQFCVICEGEGRMAVRLGEEGRSLDEIRSAIDRRYA